ncbi:hypothetical protein [Rhodococcus sp. WAY2]|uniref:hypothetical protein n=1 Tax=Rhodococcus sp. WAY2 TaxID=2663121 RepID=UPI0013597E64|nr:hypothetical protein [Rhodococcus sp. WAY2]
MAPLKVRIAVKNFSKKSMEICFLFDCDHLCDYYRDAPPHACDRDALPELAAGIPCAVPVAESGP